MKLITDPSRDSNMRSDWTTATLTSLALLGLSGGCANQSIEEQILSRPQSSITEYSSKKNIGLHEVGRELTLLNVRPILIETDFSVSHQGFKHSKMHLDLNLRYRLQSREDDTISDIVLIDNREIELRGRYTMAQLKDIRSSYILSPNTITISGKVQNYSNSSDSYLKLLGSLYDSATTSTER